MSFQRGQPRPPNAGRKPGSKNKRKVTRVADYLAENGVNPAEQILTILADPEIRLHPKDRADIWLDLLSYCEAKPKPTEESFSGDEDLEDFENISNDELLKLVKAPNGVA